MKEPRVLVYVQHLLGIGHLRRAVRLADALVEAGATVCCVSGGLPVRDLAPRVGRFEQLPPARAQDATFKALVDADGQPVDSAWRRRRRDRLLDLHAAFAPDVTVTESFPFGRRLLRFELEPLVRRVAHDPRQRMVASVRDILEGYDRPTVRAARAIHEIGAWYDLVLVHGDPAWCDLGATFTGASCVAERIRYTGYVTDRPPAGGVGRPPGVRPGSVLVSTGGGAVGIELATAAIAAARSAWNAYDWHILVGDNLAKEEFDELRRRAGGHAIVERNRPDFLQLLDVAGVSVSQAGYNTVAEVLAAGVPAVLVPYVAAGQAEQTFRAALLAERRRAVMLPGAELELDVEGRALLQAVEQAQSLPAAGGADVALDGAATAAAAVVALASC